jgi:hypothetical protein
MQLLRQSRRPVVTRMTFALALTLGLAVWAPRAHAESADVLAARLAALRAEVEDLSERLTAEKSDARHELQALARQQADLQLELDREQVRIDKLRAALANKRDHIEQTSTAENDLSPVYDAATAGLRAYIERSLPFRRDERLAEITKIDDQLRTGVLTYPRALTRLWGLIEDELRLTRESGGYRQTVTIDGSEVLAEVVRVGMVMLFFKTDDGALGYARRTDAGWVFVRAASAEERTQIRTLFDSLQKQIRVGAFVLPGALSAVER